MRPGERAALLALLAFGGCGRIWYTPATAVDGGLDAARPAEDTGASDAAMGGSCLFARGAPGMGECPTICSGGCVEGTCTITCNDDTCSTTALDCPAGWPCELVCLGTRSCQTASIDASMATSLRVSCSGTGACAGSSFSCPPTGSCQLACSGTSSCGSSTVLCGDGACGASCVGDLIGPLTVVCGAASCCSAAGCL